VARLQKDTQSILWLYRRLIDLRRTEASLTAGTYVPIRSRHGVLLYKRVWAGRETMIALNLTSDPRRLEPGIRGTLRLSTNLDTADIAVENPLLRGNEGVIITLSQP
jgi:alpha-glucosidase